MPSHNNCPSTIKSNRYSAPALGAPSSPLYPNHFSLSDTTAPSSLRFPPILSHHAFLLDAIPYPAICHQFVQWRSSLVTRDRDTPIFSKSFFQ